MEIVIGGEKCFENQSNFIVEKSVILLYGKNGTGKSTLAKLIKAQQAVNYDVRIFDGFDGVVNADRDLDLVLLGEENIKIEEEIGEKKKQLEKLQSEINSLRSELEDTESASETSIVKRSMKMKNEIKKENDKIDAMLRDIAREIKNQSNPQISSPSYDITRIKNELEEAQKQPSLSELDVQTLAETINSQEKIAPNLDIVESRLLKQYFDRVNEIICREVHKKVSIARLENDNEEGNKSAFAKQGLVLHKPGDKCIFCGNVVTEDTLKELCGYFNAEDITKFQSELRTVETELEDVKNKIGLLKIDESRFYPEYAKSVSELSNNLEKTKIDYIDFVSVLVKQLSSRNKNVFQVCEKIKSQLIPSGLEKIQEQYDDYKKQNNSIDLNNQRDEAKKKMRYNFINTELAKNEYEAIKKIILTKQGSLQEIEKEKNECAKTLADKENAKKVIEEEIVKLQQKTKNEKKLAKNITDTLKSYVSFSLEPAKNENRGCYQVKDNDNGQVRKVGTLSRGEKNIIAFLYFVEKLREIKEDESNEKKKIVIFDDPMDSNDDTMQYIIMEKLTSISDKLQEYNIEYLIVMTHNTHFFLNIGGCGNYGMKKLGNDGLFWAVKSGNKSEIKRMKKDDIKSAYDSLWIELDVVYKSDDVTSELLANVMRRIIDSFVTFNGIDRIEFFGKIVGAKKCFDVNSHEVDPNGDICADLSPMTKEDLVSMFRNVFIKNGYENHYKKHSEGRSFFIQTDE